MKINTEITTKEQAEKLIEELKNFNEPLQFGRWIKDDIYPKYLFLYDKDNELIYGINVLGKWQLAKLTIENPNDYKRHRYATDQEILDGLSEKALKLGYEKGVVVDLSSIIDIKENECVRVASNKFMFVNDRLFLDGFCILKDGEWATIIKQEPTTLESLEKRIAALESKLK